ncbi:MAG: 2-deoxyribose-5-phosphate aldolase [Chitinophagaceae bacterium]|nr:MAG: 2-deoxyribose-5-phosphate aldolase [Chitinophagaceae bacterium]
MENIEYSYLDPKATLASMEKFCVDIKIKKARSISVPPLFVKKTKELLGDSGISVASVISFPFGWSVIESKVAEVILAMIDGADELDVVINLTALKNNDWQYLAKELNTLLTVIRKQQKSINIIIESRWLDKEDITRCCDLYGAAGIDCLSLSTGMHDLTPGFDIVRAVRSQLAEAIPIKITGSSLDEATIDLYRQAGAKRISIFVK